MPVRTPMQREADLARIAKLYAKGLSQYAISEILSNDHDRNGPPVTQVTVHNDIKLIIGRWQKEASSTLEHLRGEELLKLNALEAEAWEAWERSLRDKTVEETEEETWLQTPPGAVSAVMAGANVTPNPVLTRKRDRRVSRREQSTGDARYLQIIDTLSDRRTKLLGLYPPTKVAPTNPEGTDPYAAVDPTALFETLTDKISKLIDTESERDLSKESDETGTVSPSV